MFTKAQDAKDFNSPFNLTHIAARINHLHRKLGHTALRWRTLNQSAITTQRQSIWQRTRTQTKLIRRHTGCRLNGKTISAFNHAIR